MIKNEKNALKLSVWQKQLLVGLLLGDGHLETVNNKTYRLRVEHGEKQKEYLFWLQTQFSEWLPKIVATKKVCADGRVSYEIVTCYHGAFRFFAQQFYVGKKKQIPKLFSRLINPVALAIWFIDDGSKKSSRHKTFVIHTLGYSHKDLVGVQRTLEQKFHLNVMIHKQRNNTWRLYIVSESAKKFAHLIYPVVSQVPTMLYKLENNMPKL